MFCAALTLMRPVGRGFDVLSCHKISDLWQNPLLTCVYLPHTLSVCCTMIQYDPTSGSVHTEIHFCVLRYAPYMHSTSKSHDHETYHITRNMRGVRGDVGEVWACSCCELLATGGPIIFAQIGVCVSQTGCTAAQHDTLNHWFGKQRDNPATSSKRSESVEKVNTLLHPHTNKRIRHDSRATDVINVYMSRNL